MGTLTLMIPIDMADDPTVPELSPDDFELIGAPAGYEVGSYAHWQFYDPASGLVDPVTGHELTPISTAPTDNDTHITIPNATGKGMRTDYADSENRRCTLWGIYRFPDDAYLYTPFGSLEASVGGGMYAGPASSGVRNVGLTFRGTTFNSTIVGTVQPGQWVFLATTVNMGATPTRATALVGNSSSGYDGTGSGSYLPKSGATPFLTLGRDTYTSTQGGSFDCAECGITSAPLTLNALKALRDRRRLFLESIVSVI
ncbi:hypothetical protein EV675_2108 [Pigmentiphaga kullae]|uniref:Uncharacterized protein n=2 Tax=Pigmentiphaga kullae TaxID=151784 RepID=A0A4Q7NLQ0_9BURK|nr:hypothetical protein EV675_2108 [Pigmentiphaga kullae]